MRKIKVLFTAVWYPNKYDAMDGLFIRKHAAAVARFADVCVAHVKPDPNQQLFHWELTRNEIEGVKEYSLYYYTSRLPLLRQFFTLLNFFIASFIITRTIWNEQGRHDITHVNVLTRLGVTAWLMKKIFGIPYVITEHWTRYLPNVNNFRFLIRRVITQKAVADACKVMPVSGELKNAMLRYNLCGDYHIVGNVVDDFFYAQPSEPHHSSNVVNILHVSCFLDRQKNISGIINVMERLAQRRQDWRLVVAGTGKDFDKIYSHVQTSSIKNRITFLGELTPEEIKAEFDKSDFFLLFSNYETAAVVLQESMACGKPWVTSNVGIATEDTEEANGKKVNAGDEVALLDTLDWMIDHYTGYDADAIRERAKKYRYDNIGQDFCNIYKKALQWK